MQHVAVYKHTQSVASPVFQGGSPSIHRRVKLQWIALQRCLLSNTYFRRQVAPHGFPQEFLVHTPGHWGYPQKKAHQALIVQRGPRFDWHTRPARVLRFDYARPVRARQRGIAPGMKRVHWRSWSLKLLPAAAQVQLLFKLRFQPWRVILRLHVAAHPAPQSRAYSCAQRRKSPVTERVGTERAADLVQPAPLQKVDKIWPCPPRQDVIASIAGENYTRVLRHLAVVLDVQRPKWLSAWLWRA